MDLVTIALLFSGYKSVVHTFFIPIRCLSMLRNQPLFIAAVAIGACSSLVAAGGGDGDAGHVHRATADDHAPIGVMGDHLHAKGEWMVSYRYMRMDMKDNIEGGDSISADDIVTSIANPFAGPPTVRVVPVQMTTEMHMIGMMYAPSDRLTLMAMFNYIKKSMDHRTYMGMMGTNQLGTFSTSTSGIGDTKVAALWGLYSDDRHNLHLNLGVSLPTGSIDEEDDVLTPMNTRPTLRLPYAMQLGSGTYDLEPGITYSGNDGKLGWGAQWLATVRLSENDEDYTLGDMQRFTAWSSYRLKDSLSASVRLSYKDQDDIDGFDAAIAAPVTTANPSNYGGETLTVGVGVNYIFQQGALRGNRLAVEYEDTIDQDANGVQMEMQDMLTLGWQLAF